MGVTLLWACVACPYTFTPWLVLPGGRCAEEGGLSLSGGAPGAQGDVPSQQGRKMVEGNQLLLNNLTFETSSNFSCRVMAPSVPGLEQSKQVAVTVQGKNRRVGG